MAPLRGARLALSLGVLLAVPLLALNLRPAVTSVGAMLTEIQAGTGMSAVLASAVVAAPVWCFAIGGGIAWAMRARFGTSRTVSFALAALAVTLAVRVLAGPYLLLAGTLVACLAIAVLGTLLPVITHAAPARAWALLTGCYIAAMGGGSGIGALITPRVAGHSSWQLGVSGWALLAAAAWAVWRVASRRFTEPPVRATKHPGPRSLAPAGTAWALTIHFGLTSGFTFSIMGWLPSILIEYSLVEPARVEWMFTVAMALGVPIALLVPKWARGMIGQSGLAVALAAPSLAATVGLLMYPGLSPWLWSIGLGLGMPAVGLALAMISMRSAPDGDTAAALSSMVQGIGYAIAGATALTCGLLHSMTQSWDWPLLALLIVLCGQIMFGMYAGQPITVYAGGRPPKPRHLAAKRTPKELSLGARRAIPPAPSPVQPSSPPSPPVPLRPARAPNPLSGPPMSHPSLPPASGHGRPMLRNGGRHVPGTPRPRPTARRSHGPALPPGQSPWPAPPATPMRGQAPPPPPRLRPVHPEPAVAADDTTTTALPPKPNVSEPSTTDVLIPRPRMDEPSRTDVVRPRALAEPSATDVVVPRPRMDEPSRTDVVRPRALAEPSATDVVVPRPRMDEPSRTDVVRPRPLAESSRTEVVRPQALAESSRTDVVRPRPLAESSRTEVVRPQALAQPSRTDVVRPRPLADPSPTDVVMPQPRMDEPSRTDVVRPRPLAEPSCTDVVRPFAELSSTDVVLPRPRFEESSRTDVVRPQPPAEPSATEVVVPEPRAVEPSTTDVFLPKPRADEPSATEVVVPEPRMAEPSAVIPEPRAAEPSATDVLIPQQRVDEPVEIVAPEPVLEESELAIPEPRVAEPPEEPATDEVLVPEPRSAEQPAVDQDESEADTAGLEMAGPQRAEPVQPRARGSYTPVQLELGLVLESPPEPDPMSNPARDPAVVREPTMYIPHPRRPSS